jgi:hypothetical protein
MAILHQGKYMPPINDNNDVMITATINFIN